MVISPWCPDCREWAPKLAQIVPAGMPVWLVGEFAPPDDVLSFAREFNIQWPILVGTSSKDEISRVQARFRGLREAFGDSRRWGVPTWIEGEIRNSTLTVHELRWPK